MLEAPRFGHLVKTLLSLLCVHQLLRKSGAVEWGSRTAMQPADLLVALGQTTGLRGQGRTVEHGLT